VNVSNVLRSLVFQITELNQISTYMSACAYSGSTENIVHELEVLHDICTRKNIVLDTFKLIEK